MKALHTLVKLTTGQSAVGDQRSLKRVPSRYYACLQAVTGAVVSDCLIKDISEAGARIVLPDESSLPKRLILRVTGEVTPLVASVVWQAGTKCGLEFDDSDPA